MASETANRDLVADLVGELLRPTLDHFVAWVGILVDGMPEAHDLVLALEHLQQLGGGFLRRREAFDQFHRRLVGAAVQRAAQRADGAGDAGVEVGQGRGANPRGEGGCVELMLGVEDQRDVHHLHVQLAGLLAVEQGEEVPADGRLVAVAVDALAFVGEAVPVGHDRREGGEQAVGDVALLVEAQPGSRVPRTEAPVRITSIGWASSGIRSRTSFSACGRSRWPWSFFR